MLPKCFIPRRSACYKRAFFLFLVALHACTVSAGYKVAVLKEIHGDVRVQKYNTSVWIPAKNNMPLYAKDKVMTRANSEAHIVFNEGHTLKLRSLTAIQLKVPRPPTKKEPQDAKPVSDIKSTGGRIFAKIKKSVAGGETKFEIASPSSIVGVRGTKFSMAVQENGDTVCSVSEGSVEIHNDSGSVVVKEGEQIFVHHETGDIPDSPSPISNEEKEEWESEKSWMDKDAKLDGKYKEDKDTDKTESGKENIKDGGVKASTQEGAFMENLLPEKEYSPVSEITTDTDFIKNLEAENLGNSFDPLAESSVIPPPSPDEIKSATEDSIEDSINEQDQIDSAEFDEETYTQ